MAITQTITPLPPAPDPSMSEEDFESLAAEFTDALPPLVTEINAWGLQANATATDITNRHNDVIAKHQSVTTMTGQMQIDQTALSNAVTSATNSKNAAAQSATDALSHKDAAAQSATDALSHKNAAAQFRYSAGGKYDSPTRRHTRNVGVFEGFIGTLTYKEGDYANATVSSDSVLGNTVVHFKLPLKSGTGVVASDTNQMYHLHFSGYALGAAKKIIEFTAAGYATHSSGLVNTEAQGTHAVTQYQGSDNHVYVRVAFGDAYYHTLSIDSMAVGNGFPLQHGSIQAIINPAATL